MRARALQIALGAPALLSDEYLDPTNTDPINIGEMELQEKILPIIIRRMLPSGDYEDYPLDIFPGDASVIARDVAL